MISAHDRRVPHGSKWKSGPSSWRRYCSGFILVSLFSSWGGLSARSLPQWSPEDRERIRKGELIVGAALLVDPVVAPAGSPPVVDPIPVPPSIIDPEPPVEEPDSERGVGQLAPTQIPSDYLDDYFLTAPETYFIDPQRLFSNQETLDQEGFLSYYADDSEVKMRIYLFDAKQEIPSEYSLKRLVDEQYAQGPLTAVVFYFLGNPQRNQLLFGGEGAEVVSAEQLRKILDHAKIKALEKSDKTSQLEAFLVQLSISTFWVEQSMLEMRAAKSMQDEEIFSNDGAAEASPHVSPAVELIQRYGLFALVGVVSFFSMLAALALAFEWWRRSRQFTFPVLDLPPRLGADYAAGIGAVISFKNNTDSPASQRNQLPDYLTRL